MHSRLMGQVSEPIPGNSSTRGDTVGEVQAFDVTLTETNFLIFVATELEAPLRYELPADRVDSKCSSCFYCTMMVHTKYL